MKQRANARRAAATVLAVVLAMPHGSLLAAERVVELRSGGGHASYKLPVGTRDVEIVEQLAGGCRFSRTWGFDLSSRELWVDKGCAGRFRITDDAATGNAPVGEASAPEGSNTGAAIAAALAIAGIAILASRDKDKDKDNGSSGGNGGWQPPEPGGRVGEIRSGSGQCLDMRGREVAQGTEAIVYPCNGGRNQRFEWTRNGELRVGGKCLDIADRSSANGARLIAWPCNGGSNQRWYPSGSQIRSHFNGKCLDVGSPRPRPETQVVVWDCNRGAGQRWWW